MSQHRTFEWFYSTLGLIYSNLAGQSLQFYFHIFTCDSVVFCASVTYSMDTTNIAQYVVYLIY
jgi:hypothetical protein